MEKISQPKTALKRFKYLILLCAIIILAIILRLFVNYETKLMPGVMATYYPIQVRSIFEDGRLGLPDLPFVFYFEAIVAKIFMFTGLCDQSACIMASSKIVDAVVYPFIAIPFYFLARSIAKGRNAPKWIPLFASALVTLSVPALVMMADFQKNSIGIMWASYYIYFIYKAAQSGKFLHYLGAVLFFLLTGLTHLGGLGFVIAFSVMFFVLLILFNRKKRKRILLVFGSSVISILIALVVLVVWDKERFDRLISIVTSPFILFENPMILGMLKGDVPLQPHLLINVVYAYIISFFGIILFIRKRIEIQGVHRTLFLTSLLLSLFLAFPFLDDEWGNRLYLMAYIPANIVLIYIMSFLVTNWKRRIVVIFAFIILILPMPVMWKVRGMMCITEEAYEDLFNLKSVITEGDESLIIARHGLEWWASWVLEADIGHGQGRMSDVLANYDHVYYLVQISGHGDFGEFGPGSGSMFPEPEIPDFAEIIYEDEFYRLAEVNEEKYNPEIDDFYFDESEPPSSDGKCDGDCGEVSSGLYYQNCEGSGSVELGTSPMDEEDFEFIIPYGLMVGGHVTPIDHQYFQPVDMNSPRDAYEVYAMADGKIVEIQHRYDPPSEYNSSGVDEYRIVFMHTCTFYTYYDLVTSLAPDIQSEFDAHKEKNYASLDITVNEGLLIGYIGGQTLDFAVWDTEIQLGGFVIPEHYSSEAWKIHTADPYHYYSADLLEFLTEKNIRTAEPIAGRIDYDIDGRLIGNWFVEGTNWYQGASDYSYWETHLSIVYDHLDPTAVMVSIGDFDGEAKQFAVKGNIPDPSDVSKSDGLIKYDLIDFQYYTASGEAWDRMSWTKGLTLQEAQQEHGCVLLKMIEDRSLKMEVFPNRSCSQASGFTKNSVMYER